MTAALPVSKFEPIGPTRLTSSPLVSSKLWRMPTRGALGNGLRVVAGAVAASDGELATPASANFQFERPDWALFRQIGTLSQKAGVPSQRLRRLVLKELVDNALDAGGKVTCGAMTADGDYYVQDDGPGLPPESVARLFSINRPLVISCNRRLTLTPCDDGSTAVVAGRHPD